MVCSDNMVATHCKIPHKSFPQTVWYSSFLTFSNRNLYWWPKCSQWAIWPNVVSEQNVVSEHMSRYSALHWRNYQNMLNSAFTVLYICSLWVINVAFKIPELHYITISCIHFSTKCNHQYSVKWKYISNKDFVIIK